jgi:hypothetical protein
MNVVSGVGSRSIGDDPGNPVPEIAVPPQVPVFAGAAIAGEGF